MSETVIQVSQLSKVYRLYEKPIDRLKEALNLGTVKAKEHHALSDVSLTVSRGETVGIIGTNGSGKSTILKIITGVLNPTSGSVQVDGRISALLELGTGFNMEYNGLENIYLNGTMMGFSEKEIDAKLQDILDFADIGEFIHQPVKTYSSGMFVRLAFAVAINIEPEILIVDEALSVGDVFFQAKCYRKFDEFKEMGKTILFVSHDLSSIRRYCDRVVLLNKGKLIADGEPKKIVDLYKRLLVNPDMRPEELEEKETEEIPEHVLEGACWKNSLALNPEVLDYGSKKAEIIDFALIDSKGLITNSIEKNTMFSIKSKVYFHEEVTDPIFTYTIKTLKGTEVTGTNTMFEKISFAPPKKGETRTATFTQLMNLQGGEYLLSLGCTGFVDGEFTVYHRLYDVCNITVVSEKNTVGFYDMNSRIRVE